MHRISKTLLWLLSISLILTISCITDSNDEEEIQIYFSVSGRVLDSSGNGISDVIVAVPFHSATTNSNGEYTIDGLSNGDYRVGFTRVNYVLSPPERSITISNSDVTQPDVTATTYFDAENNDPHDMEDITFVTIPGGTFQMGDVENTNQETDEKPVHSVILDSFEMGIYEVTNAQYAKFLNEVLASGDIEIKWTSVVYGTTDEWQDKLYYELNPLSQSPFNKPWIQYSDEAFNVISGYKNWPVVHVTWYGAKAFAKHYGFDLPTEAEWEYACRGGRQYKFGTNDGTVNETNANFDNYVLHPVDVGSYPPNPFSLYDMCGNVWEWCNDWFAKYPSQSVTNPTGPEIGENKILRGEDYGGGQPHSADRYYMNPEFNGTDIGFRVVRRQLY